MIRISHKLKYAVIALAMVSMVSCKDDDVVPPVVEKPLRAKVDYATLTPTTPYAATFVDADKKSTVDFTYGNNRYKMFQAINVYIASSISANKEIDAAVLKGMFNNTGNRFADSTKLNTSGIQLRDKVASSWTEADGEPVRKYLRHYLMRSLWPVNQLLRLVLRANRVRLELSLSMRKVLSLFN